MRWAVLLSWERFPKLMDRFCGETWIAQRAMRRRFLKGIDHVDDAENVGSGRRVGWRNMSVDHRGSSSALLPNSMLRGATDVLCAGVCGSGRRHSRTGSGYRCSAPAGRATDNHALGWAALSKRVS